MNLSSLIRHWLTFFLTIGTLFAAWQIVPAEQVDALNQAGAQVREGLVVVLSALIVFAWRWIIAKAVPYLRWGAGEVTKDGGPSGGNVPAVLLLCMGAGLMGTMASCTAAQLSAARQIPMRACVVTDQGTVCYSTKDGISAEVDAHSRK